jgi:hypothetical protein
VAERAIDGLRRLAMPFELAQSLLSAGQLAGTLGDAALARLSHRGMVRAVHWPTGSG